MGRSGGPTTRVRFSNVLKFACNTWEIAAEFGTSHRIDSAQPRHKQTPFPQTNMTGKQGSTTPAHRPAVQQAAHS
jgi:hypothetical protein